MKLKDKVALVTGGGRGIGKAVALAYSREGASLAVCARTEREIEETAQEIKSLGRECLGIVCDVSSEESVNGFLDKVAKNFGRVDVLVNNAGVITQPAPAAEFEIKKWSIYAGPFWSPGQPFR